MCGLTGIYNFNNNQKVDKAVLIKMVAQIKHRGPDEAGIYITDKVGLGFARLSMLDLASGKQPMHNEDKTVWIIFTGEIYNHAELRKMMEDKGHRFYTNNSDTECLVHLYEELGIDFIKYLNGQFAIAMWDENIQRLLLIRDRCGVRPLYYTIKNGRILFASEIKSIFTHPEVKRKIDLKGLDQTITLWTKIGTTTAFEDIHELPPAHYLGIHNGNITVKRYWDYIFPDANGNILSDKSSYMDRLREGLFKSVSLRLSADVSIGLYISGGVDSSILATIVNELVSPPALMKTFSVQFDDATYDETEYQKILLNKFNMKNFSVRCSGKDIGEIFPKIIWHAENFLFRTAPAPLFLLSRLARSEGVKAVLSGEGADEIFWGYDTFREQKIRLFWSKYPNSSRRPLLLQKIFPYLSHFKANYFAIIKKFYQKGLMDVNNPFYSHLPRWNNNEAIKLYYSEDTKSFLKGYNLLDDLHSLLPEKYSQWHPLERNQYLETLTLLPGYLLSSQGDKMLMANSVEGRYPFLDRNIIEMSTEIPPKYKVYGIKDKYILREAFKQSLPERIYKRNKFAYTSPDAKSFLGENAPRYIKYLLSCENIKKTNYFNLQATGRLIEKLTTSQNEQVAYRDNMAITIIVSTLLLHDLFVDNFRISDEKIQLSADFDYRVGDRK